MNVVDASESKSPRYSVATDAGNPDSPRTVSYDGMSAVSYADAVFDRANPSAMSGIAALSAAYYRDCSLAEIVAAFGSGSTFPGLVPIRLVLDSHDADGALRKAVFAKFAARNPRFGERYADGRLLSKTAHLPFDVLSKSSGAVLHAYHDDALGEWIRDVYEIDSEGGLKFHSYVTRRNDGEYEADMDLAMAQGQGREPKLADYSGFVPPAVHDPVAKVGAVRSAVTRILDMARL